MKCDECPDKYDLKLEVPGPKGQYANIPPNPPKFGGAEGGSIVPFDPPDWDSKDCTTEDCLLNSYEAAQKYKNPYPYPGVFGGILGPNSNTFVKHLFDGCGISKIYWPENVTPYNY